MGRRSSGALPVMRRHKPTNTARIIVGVNHPELSLPRWPRLRGAGHRLRRCLSGRFQPTALKQRQ
jgi:hypothetical protein